MGATISSRLEWSSVSASKRKIDYSRSNESILHDILNYVENVATDHPSEAEVEFKQPFAWASSLQISNFGSLSVQEYDKSDEGISSKKRTSSDVPWLCITKKDEGVEVKAMTFKELFNVLKCAGEKKLKEVQLCIEANEDPVGKIMGPAYASSSGISKALLEAHEQLSRERMKGNDSNTQLDSSFRLLLVLNALDVKLLHNSVEKMGKEIRLSPQAVEAEVSVLQQFCGSSSEHCLESLDYTSDTVFSNDCRAPPWRQVYGDICYIKVKPLDGDVFYLTASTEGYYVNKGLGENGDILYDQVGDKSTTLLALLKTKSPHFSTAVNKQEFLYQPSADEQLSNKESSRPETYDVEFTEVKDNTNSKDNVPSRNKTTSSSKKSIGRKKLTSSTGTSSFKTAHQTAHWKGLGVVSEDTSVYATAGSKKILRTPKAVTRNQEGTDGDSPPRTAKSHVTIRSLGTSRRRSPATAATGLLDDISDSSEDEEEEEEQIEHKPESSADLPSEYWQIQKLIKYLKAGNQTATIIALCSLLDFDLKQETSQMAIRDVGGMDLLVNLLETQHTKCKIGALKILHEITQNAQTKIDITNLGGVPLMIQILKSSNRELKCLAAETIANVAKIPRARRIVKQHGGIQQLVNLLDDPGRPGTPTTGQRSDTEVACCAAGALWSCSKSKKNKLAMLKSGIVPLLAKHLQADDEKLLVPVIGTIQECASEKMYQELIRSEGMIEHLVRGLKKDNRELQMHCAAAIFKCAEDPVTRDMVREYGGLQPLAALLAVHEPKELLVAVTGAVWKCSLSSKNVKEFKKMKVVEHLIELLNNPMEEVLVNVVGGLGQCAKDSDNRVTIRKGGGLPPLVQLLTGTNQSLLINVTKAIEACAKEPDSMGVIDKCDGVRLLWSLLKSLNPEVQASASWAICPCIENCKDSGELVRSFVGGLELIVGLLKSPHVEVLASVCAALAKIAQDEENLGVITDHGVVPLLAALTETQDDHLRRHLSDAVARCCAWGNNRVTFGTENAVAPLVYYLRSNDPEVHRSTAQALYQLSKDPQNCITMHEHGAVKPLLHMVGASDEVLQEAAAGCISNIRHLALANEKSKFV